MIDDECKHLLIERDTANDEAVWVCAQCGVVVEEDIDEDIDERAMWNDPPSKERAS